jgi:hypothetical protein
LIKSQLLYQLSYRGNQRLAVAAKRQRGTLLAQQGINGKLIRRGPMAVTFEGGQFALPGEEECERLPSTTGWIHCSTFMKWHVFRAVTLALLMAGCATQNKPQRAEHETAYRKPLTSPGAKFGALPPAVQRTVLAEAGPAEVVDAVRDTSSGRVVYKIYFRDKDVFPPMYVAPDGSVLNPDLTVAVSTVHGIRVKLAEVPANVMKVIPERAPSGEVDYINKETWGGRVVYVVIFKDEAHNPRLFIAADGTVVEETE